MIYLCEYLFVTHFQPRTFWDKITGHVYTSHGMKLIYAENMDDAEEKFHGWFKEQHPGRKLKVWEVFETIK